MSEENRNLYEISKGHLRDLEGKEDNYNDNFYSHYATLISDNIINVDDNDCSDIYSDNSLEELFQAESSYDTINQSGRKK